QARHLSQRPNDSDKDRQDGDEAQHGAPIFHAGGESRAARGNQHDHKGELEGRVRRQPAGKVSTQQQKAEQVRQALQHPSPAAPKPRRPSRSSPPWTGGRETGTPGRTARLRSAESETT